jgi:hypothetical protein
MAQVDSRDLASGFEQDRLVFEIHGFQKRLKGCHIAG